jgi:hypothetical protein
MTVRLFDSRGTPLERQKFTLRELTPKPLSKLDDDAFSRVRVILMNGIEQQANRFQHMCGQFNRDLRVPLAQIRRVEHHQQTMVNWLLGSAGPAAGSHRLSEPARICAQDTEPGNRFARARCGIRG